MYTLAVLQEGGGIRGIKGMSFYVLFVLGEGWWQCPLPIITKGGLDIELGNFCSWETWPVSLC